MKIACILCPKTMPMGVITANKLMRRNMIREDNSQQRIFIDKAKPSAPLCANTAIATTNMLVTL